MLVFGVATALWLTAAAAGAQAQLAQGQQLYYFNEFNDLHEGDWEGMQLLRRVG